MWLAARSPPCLVRLFLAPAEHVHSEVCHNKFVCLLHSSKSCLELHVGCFNGGLLEAHLQPSRTIWQSALQGRVHLACPCQHALSDLWSKVL